MLSQFHSHRVYVFDMHVVLGGCPRIIIMRIWRNRSSLHSTDPGALHQIVVFQPYASLVLLVHQATKVECQVADDFAAKPTTSAQPTSQQTSQANSRSSKDLQVLQADPPLHPSRNRHRLCNPLKHPRASEVTSHASSVEA